VVGEAARRSKAADVTIRDCSEYEDDELDCSATDEEEVQEEEEEEDGATVDTAAADETNSGEAQETAAAIESVSEMDGKHPGVESRREKHGQAQDGDASATTTGGRTNNTTTNNKQPQTAQAAQQKGGVGKGKGGAQKGRATASMDDAPGTGTTARPMAGAGERKD
jgi:hypothetical protein